MRCAGWFISATTQPTTSSAGTCRCATRHSAGASVSRYDRVSPARSPVPALTLLIIRHAEKPGENWPGPGLTLDGAPDDKSLVIRGWQRTGAWTTLFGAGLVGADYPAPAAIYAANPAGSTSQRPYETITALAPRLGITPNTTYATGQEDRLVKELLGLSGVVLVAWEHKAIVEEIVP